MADCKQTLRELDAFLDDELSATTREQIHNHLEGCVDCLQAFDFQAELKLAIGDNLQFLGDQNPAIILAQDTVNAANAISTEGRAVEVVLKTSGGTLFSSGMSSP